MECTAEHGEDAEDVLRGRGEEIQILSATLR